MKQLFVVWLALAPGPALAQTEIDAGAPRADAGAPDAGAADAAAVPPGANGPLLPAVLLEQQNRGLEIARRYARLLLGGHGEEAALFHDEPGGRRPDLPALRACAERGTPAELEPGPVAQTQAETTAYFFLARYLDGPDLPLRVSVDHAGHVAGAACGPQAVLPARFQRYDRYDGYRPRAALSLPFAGTWTAINATPGQDNGHYLNSNQRFAVDFLITRDERKGSPTYRGSGRENADYYAYGKEVLAPAAGKVVQVVDGVPDNRPGQVDVYFRLGNMIVLDLGGHEYAYLCHLKPGSITVRPGQSVRRGQPLARCGNSGNSTEPHLHFQLADGPLISRAASLPALFRRVLNNGLPADDVMPQNGDRLSDRPPGRRP